MEIRGIKEKDIPAILELVGGTISDPIYREKHNNMLDKKMRGYLKDEARSAQYIVLDGEKIIAFALAGVLTDEDELGKYHYCVFHTDRNEPLSWIMLWQITVDSDYRGKNIGSMLLDRIEQRVKELNLKGVYTGTRGNIRFFYEKNGFVIDKVFLKKPITG